MRGAVIVAWSERGKEGRASSQCSLFPRLRDATYAKAEVSDHDVLEHHAAGHLCGPKVNVELVSDFHAVAGTATRIAAADAVAIRPVKERAAAGARPRHEANQRIVSFAPRRVHGKAQLRVVVDVNPAHCLPRGRLCKDGQRGQLRVAGDLKGAAHVCQARERRVHQRCVADGDAAVDGAHVAEDIEVAVAERGPDEAEAGQLLAEAVVLQLMGGREGEKVLENGEAKRGPMQAMVSWMALGRGREKREAAGRRALSAA